MRNILIASFLIMTTSADVFAINRGMINDYSYSLNAVEVRKFSGRVLLSEYGVNMKQEVRDFNDVKNPPYFKFQKLITNYNKSKYCIPRTFEVSFYETTNILYLPTLKSQILSIMKSRGNIYDSQKSINQGAMFWKSLSGAEIVGVLTKSSPLDYVFSICTLKGG